MDNSIPPQILAQMNQLTGRSVTSASANSGMPSRASEVSDLIRQASQNNPQTNAPAPSFADRIKAGYNSYASGVNKVASDVVAPITNAGTDIAKTASDYANGNHSLGSLATAGYHVGADIAGGAVGAIGAPVSDAVNAIGDQIGNSKTLQSVATSHTADNLAQGTQNAKDLLGTFEQAHPGATQFLKDTGKYGAFAGLFAGDNPGVKSTLSNAADTASTGIKTATGAAKELVNTPMVDLKGSPTLAEATAASSKAQNLQTSIDAVNPDLSGKKLASAYKDVVTGSRTTDRTGMMGEQTLSPSAQATRIGTRLANPIDGVPESTPVGLTSDPLKNLSALKDNLTQTEASIGKEFAKNPSIPADKPTLSTSFDDLKKTIPREFSSIKDSKTAFNSVVDFAKETLDNAKDNLQGLRDSRTSFDAQAKLEYPNAFKDGMVDVKTPAGRAIKAVRDLWNQHLYATAPEGSPLQKLIERESDIFRASEPVAARAAKLHGSTAVGRYLQNHPIIGGTIKTGLRAIKLGGAIKLGEAI